MISDSISYWQRTAPIIPLSTGLPRWVDVAVIGGGLMGTATSYWLAHRGVVQISTDQTLPLSSCGYYLSFSNGLC